MNIGELARHSGVSTDTLRFYEREGLLDAPPRSANGYRSYDTTDLERVRFVRAAQALGFSLAEIARIVPRLAIGGLDRDEIRGHLQAKIGEIDAQVRRLRALRRELMHTCETLPCAPENKSQAQAGMAVPSRPRGPSGVRLPAVVRRPRG